MVRSLKPRRRTIKVHDCVDARTINSPLVMLVNGSGIVLLKGGLTLTSILVFHVSCDMCHVTCVHVVYRSEQKSRSISSPRSPLLTPVTGGGGGEEEEEAEEVEEVEEVEEEEEEVEGEWWRRESRRRGEEKKEGGGGGLGGEEEGMEEGDEEEEEEERRRMWRS